MIKYYASRDKKVTEAEQRHMDFVREKAGECMVLLKNDGALPILKTGKIALFGNAARQTIKGGTGSGDVNSRFVVNIEQGLEDAGFTVTTKGWLDAYDDTLKKAKEEYQKNLERRAEKEKSSVFVVMMDMPFIEKEQPLITDKMIQESDTDTAIFVVSRNSGEGADRFNCPGDYELLPDEIANLTKLGQNYKKVILLLNVGGVINSSQIESVAGINSILMISQSGNQIGSTVADVLTAKTTPSGKLTATWAKEYSDYPCADTFSHNNGNWHEEYYNEGIYVGYRYFDSFNIVPNYCFGYGLSYTSFTWETVNITADEETVSVQVRVKNIGNRFSGKEIIQLYVSAPSGVLEKTYQELRAFGKTKNLAPGEEQELILSFKTVEMASYSEEYAAWILEKGDYILRVGNSSRNTRVAVVLELDADATVRKLKNLTPSKEKPQEISSKGIKAYSYEGETEEINSAKKIFLTAACFKLENIEYHPNTKLKAVRTDAPITLTDIRNGKYSVEDLVSQLTVEEMADLCVGTVRDGMGFGEGNDNVVGSASNTVPGAAGDTSGKLEAKRGISNLILADGPAGLRLTPHFCTSKDGVLREGGEIYGDLAVEIKNRESDDIDYYQYCTAIPIATLLASSWDMELIENMGKIVGEEMETFHVNLWLAPGMNIHRNPLCGRNFEYYSEDPLLSGLCAAAETKGVQSYPTCGVTLKHFACNNQETNRFFVNEHISERALREIYLKNFEICIRNSQPMSMMSSYNLINDVHAANSRELLTDVVRQEWGYKGIVMTDWFATQKMSYIFSKPNPHYGYSDSVQCIFAGNELQMPGCQENVDDIVNAIKNGMLEIADLQECVIRIINAVWALM